ncbi:peptidylprolyl isomerase [Thalassotalea ponticola]|uniref:peptidylprolyl isomerase n=1 Tax=Thalassotalea ponticola TaxID=1523392 RepID=UPI0025B3D486|nr:peptidylprolyl isomerase [Thalassotalea ponticola]MDN3652153.1 peptidylprolyl isomerase [Thalassotalea ponticola]
MIILRALAVLLIWLSFNVHGQQPTWRLVDQQNLLYIETEHGLITIELAEFFAPRHVAHIQQLVRRGFYDGLPFYRVIENFVVQAGDQGYQQSTGSSNAIRAEMTRPIEAQKSNVGQQVGDERPIDEPFTLVQDGDLLAPQTGFINGFAVARSPQENKQWLIHCPGVINLARGTDIHSGTTDFAIMLGVPPRHLDRNMSVFGRVIDGWQTLYRITLGDNGAGGFADLRSATIIKRAYLGSQQAPHQQVWIEDTSSEHFRQKLAQRRLYQDDFFDYKGNNKLDVCYQKVAVKTTASH